MNETIVKDVYVARHDTGTRVWEEGDKFSLKDVDGCAPTGEYTIKAIRVQYVSIIEGMVPRTRVWFCNQDGSWVRDIHCVPFEPKSTRAEAAEALRLAIHDAITEHGVDILRVPCEHGGTQHPVVEPRVYGKDDDEDGLEYVYLFVDDTEYL